MDLGLEGRSAIVTGGRTGIGAAIVRALAREGCDVAIVDRVHDALANEVVDKIEALGRRGLFFEADVESFADAERAVETVTSEFDRLDIMICNAGINRDRMIWRMSEAEWDEVIGVNLKGYFNYNRAAAAIFKDQKWGKIVNIASINGLRGKLGQSNYTASKGGAIALTKTLARELGRYNVNVNAVAPGMVMTEMARGTPREFLDRALDETVLGRLAEPEDCANVVAFLCSDRARHITGSVIQVDGGQYI